MVPQPAPPHWTSHHIPAGQFTPAGQPAVQSTMQYPFMLHVPPAAAQPFGSQVAAVASPPLVASPCTLPSPPTVDDDASKPTRPQATSSTVANAARTPPLYVSR